MKLEAVGRVTMRDLALEVRRQVDDGNRIEGAFLGADTTTNAETLRDEGDSRIRGHLDAQLPASYDRAGFLAFLSAFLDGARSVSMFIPTNIYAVFVVSGAPLACTIVVGNHSSQSLYYWVRPNQGMAG